MLDTRDIQVIRELLNEQTEKFDQKLKEQSAQFDQKLKEQVDRLDKKIDKQSANFDQKLKEQSHTLRSAIADTETLLIGEISRVQEQMDKKFDKVYAEMNELKEYYRANKLTTDNNALMLRLIEAQDKQLAELNSRVSELEKKTA